MSFRLRVFLLVMLVAVTAIGATAGLTLSLTRREVTRSQQAQVRHQTEIVDAIARYGRRHGHWSGVDRVLAALSQRTDLHIQLRTQDGEVVVDSDTIAGRASGPVQSSALDIDPRPVLDQSIPQPSPGADAVPPSPVVLRNLFGAGPAGRPGERAVRQAAQYRVALAAVACAGRKTGGDPALLTDDPPYLTPAQLTDDPSCLRAATGQVVSDTAWWQDMQRTIFICAKANARARIETTIGSCLQAPFSTAVSTAAPVPLKLYLGGHTGTDVAELGRPALFGAAGLIVVAVLGTALIARQVSRPVRRLTEASRRLAGGRLDVRVPAGRRNELGRLSASFNTMAEAVQRSEERQRRLIADVAHEMRTPLSNLRGYLEGLSDGVIEPRPELFASLHEETLLQGRILDDLQVLALAEAGDLGYARAPADLAELAASGATAHRAVAAEAGIGLTVDAPYPVWVDGDPDRLRQVLGNLVSNAIRYTDRGGHVLIRVRPAGAEAELTVRDTGIGIPAGDLGRVFDRFWRADPARQRATGGTGLGLTIAHRIVTDHGGRIEVASRRHMGTTFTIRLPGGAQAPGSTGRGSRRQV